MLNYSVAELREKKKYIIVKGKNKRIGVYKKSSARTEQGFFASFFLALRAHERKKLGGIFQPSNFSCLLMDYIFPSS